MKKFQDDEVHVLTKAEVRILMERNKHELDDYKARDEARKKRRRLSVNEIDTQIAELQVLRKQALEEEVNKCVHYREQPPTHTHFDPPRPHSVPVLLTIVLNHLSICTQL